MSLLHRIGNKVSQWRNKIAHDDGFTIIEVLTVSVIVGAILSIVLTQFGNYRERAHVLALKSDTRLVAQAFELVYAEQTRYPTVVAPGVNETGIPTVNLYTGTLEAATLVYQVPVTMGVTMNGLTLDSDQFSFTMGNASNPALAAQTWDSSTGGFE